MDLETVNAITDTIDELTKELKLHRLAIVALHKTIQDVIDPGVNENFPGYVRIGNLPADRG